MANDRFSCEKMNGAIPPVPEQQYADLPKNARKKPRDFRFRTSPALLLGMNTKTSLSNELDRNHATSNTYSNLTPSDLSSAAN